MKASQIAPSVYLQLCPSRELLVRIADKWATMALLALSESTLRFGELQRKMQGVSQKMLTQTLKNLERDGLIKRVVFTGRPLRVDYSLTEQGKSLIHILNPVVLWAESNIKIIVKHRELFDTEQTIAPSHAHLRVKSGKKLSASWPQKVSVS